MNMQVICDYLRKNDVKTILDIGANVGAYSMVIKELLPEAYILMLEANLFCAPFLEKTGIPYDIACLSDVEKSVKMYVNKKNVVCTGTSYYKENTEHYSEEDYITVTTRTLDNVIISKYGEQKKFDFIKMDTQGSEKDIINGGKKTIDAAKFIQLELSLIEYNKGAPLKNEMIDFLFSLGFTHSMLVDTHYWNQNPNEKAIQEDWIFIR